MRRRRLNVGCALLVGACVVVVNLAYGYVTTALATFPKANSPSYTVAASKARGAFVESVTLEPAVIDWNGRRIAIREAWLEHQTELVFIYSAVPVLLEWPSHRRVGGYNLCITLAGGWDVLWEHPSPFFFAEGKGSGFCMRGTTVLWEQWYSLDNCPKRIFVTDNFQCENSQALTIKRGGG